MQNVAYWLAGQSEGTIIGLVITVFGTLLIGSMIV